MEAAKDNSSLSHHLFPKEEKEHEVIVALPPPAKDDPLLEKKEAMLSKRKINLVFHVLLANLAYLKTREYVVLEEMIKAARILQLDETEWYFVEDDDFGPFTPRNELEALNLVHSIICNLLHSASIGSIQSLQALQNAIVDKLDSFANEDTESIIAVICNGQEERHLLDWAVNHGVKSKLNIAAFEGYGRGMIAMTSLNVGDIALEIPQALLICEDIALRSDMSNVLESIGGLAPETITLLWSMRERHISNSEFKPYFAALPKTFNTGLSFGINALTALEGTLLLEEILQAKQHLRSQYDALFPMLSASHPEIFPPEFYTWDQFLWACELWYSNGMKVAFPDGKLKTCLVPMASLLNHSLHPHVMHYSKIDVETKSLKLYVSRPCKSGKQCFLSYGPLSSSHLLTFYGFLPIRDNPYDIIPIDLDLSQTLDPSNALPEDDYQISHMVRGTWLSNSELNNYGLPSRLLAALRIAFLDEDDVKLLPQNPRLTVINKENEKAVLETILSIMNPMLDSMGEPDDFTSEDSNWDINLAEKFKDCQRRLIASICDSCSRGLQALDSTEVQT